MTESARRSARAKRCRDLARKLEAAAKTFVKTPEEVVEAAIAALSREKTAAAK